MTTEERLLGRALTFVLRESIPRDAEIEPYGERLQARFHDALRDLEAKARREVEHIYQHSRLVRDEHDLEPAAWGMDLFAKDSFRLLGLKPAQLILASSAAGATLGGGLDAAVGGASFGGGIVIGAMVGGAAAAYYSEQNIANVRTVWRGFRGDRLLEIGPHRNPNFPWVLLDRALLHWAAVSDRAHARRDPLALRPGDKQGIVLRLSEELRRQLGTLFARMRKKAARLPPELEAESGALVGRALEELAVDEENVLRAS